jgi:hypothetical protein
MSFRINRLFAADLYGVPRINVYVMRLVWLLILVFVGKDAWTHIAAHEGQWEPLEGVAWCVWAAFACFGLLGIFQTVRMIPLLLFEIFYKALWLAIVAYPLWVKGTLAGSPAEGIAYAFAWVILPIVAVPWPYVFRTYLLGGQRQKLERMQIV